MNVHRDIHTHDHNSNKFSPCKVCKQIPQGCEATSR